MGKQKGNWVKLTVPVSRPMFEALKERTALEGHTKAGFIRGALGDKLREEMRALDKKRP